MKSANHPADTSLLARDPVTGEPLPPRRQPGYYAGYSTLAQRPFWDDATRNLVDKRVSHPPERTFFSQSAWDFWTAVFAHLIPQSDRTADRQIPVVAMLDHRLAINQTVGYRFEDMPHDRVVYELGMEAINRESEQRYNGAFVTLLQLQQDIVLKSIHDGKPVAARDIWKQMPISRFWEMLMSDAIDAYYAHPWAWDEIGFGGPAYPRAYTRLERGEPEPWEVEEQRYDWIEPSSSVSSETDPSGDQDQSHHGSGGTH